MNDARVPKPHLMNLRPVKSMPTITNISAYRFAPLRDLKSLREKLIAQCRQSGLKGTILLSTEGINLFVAGHHADIDFLLKTLCAVPGLEGLEPKFSESREQPFHRMLVKIKREIIAFGLEGIDPARQPAPKLSPVELKRWLDEGRPVTLLDTRNDYEVKLGTFQDAIDLKIDHFRQLPDAVRKLPEALKHQPIVMFCTGGIRCEKAGPFMQREGFEKIFQLDGGILKYFEECAQHTTTANVSCSTNVWVSIRHSVSPTWHCAMHVKHRSARRIDWMNDSSKVSRAPIVFGIQKSNRPARSLNVM